MGATFTNTALGFNFTQFQKPVNSPLVSAYTSYVSNSLSIARFFSPKFLPKEPLQQTNISGFPSGIPYSRGSNTSLNES